MTGATADLQELSTAGLTDAGVAALVLEHAGQEATPERIDAVLRAYERHLPASPAAPAGPGAGGDPRGARGPGGPPRRPLLPPHRQHPGGRAGEARALRPDRFFPGEGAFCIDHGTRIDIARRALPLAEGAEAVYVIGDTPADVECGKAIGARTIAVASGWHSREELAATEPWVVLDRIPTPDEFRRLIEPMM